MGAAAARGPVLAAGALAALGTLAACSAQQPAAAAAATGVLEHHGGPTRQGVYVDPLITRQAAASMHLDPAFGGTMGAPVEGPVYAHPLYLDGVGGKPDLVFVATVGNHVYAFDAANARLVWDRQLAPPVPISALPCGSSTSQGVTGIVGTPAIDAATRSLFLVAKTTPDGGATKQHLVFALDADSGAVRPGGWPVNVAAAASSGGTAFDSNEEGQHAALTIFDGKVFVPFGAPNSDCGQYHGWVVGVSTSDPTRVTSWASTALGGGIWGNGGISHDDSSLYFATGNGNMGMTWAGGEAVFKMPPSLVFGGATTDYYAPPDFAAMDQIDNDLGSTAPIPFELAGGHPSSLLILGSKNAFLYVLDRGNLGGIGMPLAGGVQVSRDPILGAPVVYRTAVATYVTFRGVNAPNTALTAFTVTPTDPPALARSWSGGPATAVGSPTVTMTDASGANALVWLVGGDDKLWAVDGDTGASVLAGSADSIPGVLKHQTPIVAHGRIFVAGTSQLYAFSAM